MKKACAYSYYVERKNKRIGRPSPPASDLIDHLGNKFIDHEGRNIVAKKGVPPLPTDGIEFYFDISNKSTLTFNGTKVSKVTDSLGSSSTLEQVVDTRQPTYVEDGKYIDFPGGPNAFISTQQKTSKKTVFVLMRVYDIGGRYVLDFRNNDPNLSFASYVYFTDPGEDLRISPEITMKYLDGVERPGPIPVVDLVDNNWHIFGMVMPGNAGSGMYFFTRFSIAEVGYGSLRAAISYDKELSERECLDVYEYLKGKWRL